MVAKYRSVAIVRRLNRTVVLKAVFVSLTPRPILAANLGCGLRPCGAAPGAALAGGFHRRHAASLAAELRSQASHLLVLPPAVAASYTACSEVIVRILVVEDEPDLQRAIVRAIREAGFAVDRAADGAEGLFKATSADYDAIVLDLMLPVKDGWQVLKELRKSKSTPVLILTARDGVSDRIHGLDTGADDYLTKPFAIGELLARLRALIRRASGNAAAMIEIDSLVIDTAGRKVLRAGEHISLTALEYSLVELLALNRGRLVSRTMIYDHLFDENEDSLSNLVDVHISNIRKKLGHNLIVTRRGHGYLIESP